MLNYIWLKKSAETGRGEFEYIHSLQLLQRIRILSFAVVFFFPILMLYDYVMIDNVRDLEYKAVLLSVHLISITTSALFLLFNRKIRDHKKPGLIIILPIIYVFIYLLLGAVTGINSQRLYGNIEAYTVMLMIAAAVFPVKQLYMVPILTISQIVFVAGIRIHTDDSFKFLSKALNSTALYLIAIILSYIFYNYKYYEYRNKQKLYESEKNLNKIFDITPHPLFITRYADGTILRASKYACEFFGLSDENLTGSSIIEMYTDPNDRDALLNKLRQEKSLHNHIIQLKLQGANKWVMANFELFEYNEEDCILCSIMDITELKLVEEELSNYASTDMLTGVLNRRGGYKLLENLVDESRNQYLEFVVCFIDLNGLKHVNDVFGHAEGDNYIKTVCQIIKENISDQETLFRMGGDEFIVVFPDKKPDSVRELWDKITFSFSAINGTNSLPYKIAVSHGLYHFRSGSDIDVDKMIHAADYEMYKEKFIMKETG